MLLCGQLNRLKDVTVDSFRLFVCFVFKLEQSRPLWREGLVFTQPAVRRMQRDLPVCRYTFPAQISRDDYDDGFFLACEEFWRTFDHSFPACAFFFFKVKISSRTLIPLLGQDQSTVVSELRRLWLNVP